MQENAQRLTNPTETKEKFSFEDIYELYGDRILNLIFRLCGNEEIARDLTQDVFIKVYQNLKSFEYKSQIYTWIYRIAVNHTLNHIKKIKRQKWSSIFEENILDLLNKGTFESENIENTLPDKILERKDREKIIWDTIHSLPDKYRIPLSLFRYEELSYKEIAENLDLSMGTVESHIHRAKKLLIKKLEQLLDKI